MNARALVWLPAMASLGACAAQYTGDQVLPVTLQGWSDIHHDVIVPSCAFGSCHAGAQPAAHLDLSSPTACAQLVQHASCLFPGQVLVSPGAPDESFLMAKLTGKDLAPRPDGDCGGASNLRMPFGAQPLPEAQIAAIRSWIAAGASCGDAAPPSMNPAPPMVMAPSAKPAVDPPAALTGVQALSLEQPLIMAGARVALSVVLSQPAGAGGTPVRFDVSDRSILGAPATILVPEGQSSVASVVIGKRPGAARLEAHVDGDATAAGASATVAVTGLLLTEILVAATSAPADGSAWVKIGNVSAAPIDLGAYRLGIGVGSFTDAAATLTGILPPGACVVVGGPRSDDGNGGPAYGQVWDISSQLQATTAPGGAPTGMGILDAAAAPAAALIDGVTLASADDSSAVAIPAPGSSLVRRTLARWVTQPVPTPGDCAGPASDR